MPHYFRPSAQKYFDRGTQAKMDVRILYLSYTSMMRKPKNWEISAIFLLTKTRPPVRTLKRKLLNIVIKDVI